MENPLTDEKISQLLDFVRSGVEKTADFVGEQAPLVCREIVAWTLWSSAAWAAFGLIFLVGAAVLAWKFTQLLRASCKDDSSINVIPCVIYGILTVVSGLAGMFTIAPNINPLIKSATAPRLVPIRFGGASNG